MPKKPSARLLAVNPLSAARRELELGKSETLLGSGEQNDLVIQDPTVSRTHAKIVRYGGRHEIVDLGSTNGTFVNGRPVRRPTRLRHGDEVRLGGAKFVFAGWKAEGASGGQRGRWRAVRTALAIVVAGVAAGFAATQYFVYRQQKAPRSQAAPSSRSSSAVGNQVRSVGEAGGASNAGGSSRMPARGGSESPTTASASWIERVNYWRSIAGVPPVKEDSALSVGDRLHARYIVKNFGIAIQAGANLGSLMHTEDPANPWYTPQGLEAAKSSDLDEWAGRTPAPPPFWAIDNWITGPFHRLWILNPGLHSAGYGEFCENGVCVAGLDVISKADPLGLKPMPLASPVEFPPQGASVTLTSFHDEWPDPLSACAGFVAPAGLPATLQLGPLVSSSVSAYSFREDGMEVAACAFTGDTYTNPDPVAQRRGADVLKDNGAIAVVPRAVLKPGHHYSVSLTAGKRTYSWSFAVSGEPTYAKRASRTPEQSRSAENLSSR